VIGNVLGEIFIAIVVALFICPTLWALQFTLFENRLGRQIFDRAQYSTGITLHYVSILLFGVSALVIVATQFCDGCSSGLIIVPLALLLAATLWTLHALARHLICKSRERPRRAV
jgi:uncharacterized membrane protein YwzB